MGRASAARNARGPIWRLPAYRYALYLEDLLQSDVPSLHRDIRTRAHVDQLLNAIGSISANIAEGYSRSTGPDRAKFFEYGLSSSREGRDWLFKVRHALDSHTFADRIELVSRIMRTLSAVIPRERRIRKVTNSPSAASPRTRAVRRSNGSRLILACRKHAGCSLGARRGARWVLAECWLLALTQPSAPALSPQPVQAATS